MGGTKGERGGEGKEGREGEGRKVGQQEEEFEPEEFS